MNRAVVIKPEIFNMNYSAETVVIYGILAFYDFEIKPEELIEMVSIRTQEADVEEVCRCALWALYKDGFIGINMLEDEVRSGQTRLDMPT